MPTHPSDMRQRAPEAHAYDSGLTLVDASAHPKADVDWDLLKRNLNDRISMVVEYGYWKSTDEFADDQVPYEQFKAVDKILAICGIETILYVTGTIQPGGTGQLIALTSRLVVRAELSVAEETVKARAFSSRIWAQSRGDISSIELDDVSEARHDINWPTRIRLNVIVDGSKFSLPLAKSHQVTKEENLSDLLPALLEDLARR